MITNVPKAWKNLHDNATAPEGHAYWARGMNVWAKDITRAKALKHARKLSRPHERKFVYAQCLPADSSISSVDGWISWDSHPKDCPHCEKFDNLISAE